MQVLDADAHVEECEATWQYLDPEFYKYRPIPVLLPRTPVSGSFNGGWIIDYKLRLFSRQPHQHEASPRRRACRSPSRRSRTCPAASASLDAIGVDKQVIFPSLWLGCLAENVALEAALARSYNEFMATQCGQSGGRLWYAAVIPFRDARTSPSQRSSASSGWARRPASSPAGWSGTCRSPTPPCARSSPRPSARTCRSPSTRATAPAPRSPRFFEGMPRPPSTSGPFFHPLGTRPGERPLRGVRVRADPRLDAARRVSAPPRRVPGGRLGLGRARRQAPARAPRARSSTASSASGSSSRAASTTICPTSSIA